MLVDHNTVPYNATVSGLAAGYRVEVADGTAEVRARLCVLEYTVGLKGLKPYADRYRQPGEQPEQMSEHSWASRSRGSLSPMPLG